MYRLIRITSTFAAIEAHAATFAAHSFWMDFDTLRKVQVKNRSRRYLINARCPPHRLLVSAIPNPTEFRARTTRTSRVHSSLKVRSAHVFLLYVPSPSRFTCRYPRY